VVLAQLLMKKRTIYEKQGTYENSDFL